MKIQNLYELKEPEVGLGIPFQTQFINFLRK